MKIPTLRFAPPHRGGALRRQRRSRRPSVAEEGL